MPFPHSSSFGYRSRVDLLACVCVSERLCGTRCRLFYFFTATTPATQLHFLHVCVVPILVLHPTRAASAASGYTCRIRRGMKIRRAVKQNGKHNQQRRTHRRRRANINFHRKAKNIKYIERQHQRHSSVFIVLLPSPLHSVRWDSSLRLELGHFSLSSKQFESSFTITTGNKISSQHDFDKNFKEIIENFRWFRAGRQTILFIVRGKIRGKERSLVSLLQTK